jgi:hypothetical protein
MVEAVSSSGTLARIYQATRFCIVSSENNARLYDTFNMGGPLIEGTKAEQQSVTPLLCSDSTKISGICARAAYKCTNTCTSYTEVYEWEETFERPMFGDSY